MSGAKFSRERAVGLGVPASVICDHETHGPRELHEGDGLRTVTVFPGPSEESFSDEGYEALRAAKVADAVLPLDSSRMEETLVQEIPIVSVYSLHVALYALQNPTPENIDRALTKIGVSGDCGEWPVDYDTTDYHPEPVPEPPGWEDLT